MTSPLHPAPDLPHTLRVGEDEELVVRPAPHPELYGDAVKAERVSVLVRRHIDATGGGEQPAAAHHSAVVNVAEVGLTRAEALDLAAALVAAVADDVRVVDLGGPLPTVQRRWEDGEPVWVVDPAAGGGSGAGLTLGESDLDVEQTMLAMRRRLAALAAADEAATRHTADALAAAQEALDELLDGERERGIGPGEVTYRAQELLDRLAPLLGAGAATSGRPA